MNNKTKKIVIRIIILILFILAIFTIKFKVDAYILFYRQCNQLVDYKNTAPYIYPQVHELNACMAKGYNFGSPITPASY